MEWAAEQLAGGQMGGVERPPFCRGGSVYDLPPGAGPVVHHASSGSETPVSAADTPPAKQPPDTLGYMFTYDPPDGKHDIIGSWTPPRLDPSANTFARIVPTNDPAEAEHWRAELAAGRFPIDIDNER